MSGKSTTGGLRLYKSRNGLIKNPFTTTTIANKFYETDSLMDKPRSGRKSIMKERVSDVTEALKEIASGDYNVTSICQISTSSGVFKTPVSRILHKNLRLWPYKISLVQGLKDGDPERRLLFSSACVAMRHLCPIFFGPTNVIFQGLAL